MIYRGYRINTRYLGSAGFQSVITSSLGYDAGKTECYKTTNECHFQAKLIVDRMFSPAPMTPPTELVPETRIAELEAELKAKDARIAELRKIGFRTSGYTFQLYIHLRNKGNDVLANEVYAIWQQAERTLEGGE